MALKKRQQKGTIANNIQLKLLTKTCCQLVLYCIVRTLNKTMKIIFTTML